MLKNGDALLLEPGEVAALISALRERTDAAPADDPEGLVLALLATQVAEVARDGFLVCVPAKGAVLAEAAWALVSAPDHTDR